MNCEVEDRGKVPTNAAHLWWIFCEGIGNSTNGIYPSCLQQWGPDLLFFGQASHTNQLCGWPCLSQKQVTSRLIHVRQTHKSGFVMSAPKRNLEFPPSPNRMEVTKTARHKGS